MIMWRTKQTNTRQVYACGTSKLLDNSDFTTVNAKRDIVCSIQLKILGSKSLDNLLFSTTDKSCCIVFKK